MIILIASLIIVLILFTIVELKTTTSNSSNLVDMSVISAENKNFNDELVSRLDIMSGQISEITKTITDTTLSNLSVESNVNIKKLIESTNLIAKNQTDMKSSLSSISTGALKKIDLDECFNKNNSNIEKLLLDIKTLCSDILQKMFKKEDIYYDNDDLKEDLFDKIDELKDLISEGIHKNDDYSESYKNDNNDDEDDEDDEDYEDDEDDSDDEYEQDDENSKDYNEDKKDISDINLTDNDELEEKDINIDNPNIMDTETISENNTPPVDATVESDNKTPIDEPTNDLKTDNNVKNEIPSFESTINGVTKTVMPDNTVKTDVVKDTTTTVNTQNNNQDENEDEDDKIDLDFDTEKIDNLDNMTSIKDLVKENDQDINIDAFLTKNDMDDKTDIEDIEENLDKGSNTKEDIKDKIKELKDKINN